MRALLLNALEAVEDKPVVLQAHNRRLTADEGPRFLVEVEVLDDGPGIGAMTWEIFSAFFTTKEGHRGTGLTAAFGLAARNNAVLRVESRPESGTRACLLFPAARF